MIQRVLKEISRTNLLISILAIIFGLVLVCVPQQFLVTLGMIVGIYLIVQGIGLIVFGIRARRVYLPFDGTLLGVLSVLLGVLFFMLPVQIAVYIGVALGIWVIVSSINNIKTAIALKGKDAEWVFMLILNILDLLIGVLILLAPTLAATYMTIYVGVGIIVHAVLNLVHMYSIKKNLKELEKIIKER